MRKASWLSGFFILFALQITAIAQAQSSSLCDQPNGRCLDRAKPYVEGYEYVGHDEPSLLFYSNIPGSGNSSVYLLRLPKDPPTLPKQDGSGGTFNTQLHPAFWFGMAICDTESFPEYSKTCTPDSDANIFDDPSAAAPRYIGHHSGTAFLEMQFYPPGFVTWPSGDSCDATRYCAALNIDSLGFDPNNNLDNNSACLGTVGEETVNFAFITKSGIPHAPPNPVDGFPFTSATFTPNPQTDLFMNPGDLLRVVLRDTPHGLQVSITDLTTGNGGSMIASAANGFGQVKFDPHGTTCQNIPYDFHPMYSTSSEHTRVPWAAHSYNVAFSDETGHFEYCGAVSSEGGTCTQPSVNDAAGPDDDDNVCFDASASTLIPVGGCLDSDVDFDGVPYQLTWPGTLSNQHLDGRLHPEPIRFTSPLFVADHDGRQDYQRVAFETALPAIEGSCDPFSGTGCSNPPPGANFYPLFSTAHLANDNNCFWQIGGNKIPGTTNTFGGTSTAEFGPILFLTYPVPGGSVSVIEDYRRVLSRNPCPA